MTQSLPTTGQLERALSQRLQALYRTQLGQRVQQVSCRLFGSRLAIVLEDAITPAEQILLREGKEELAEKVRDGIDDAIEPQIAALIEEVLGVQAIDFLADSALETGRTGAIVVLSAAPLVRNPDAPSKERR